MPGNDVEVSSRALREFARQVLRDQVDSDHLREYVGGLLSRDLIEPPASCRYEAAVLARCFPGMRPREVANHLIESARQLERATTSARSGTAPLRPLPQPTIRPNPTARTIRTNHARELGAGAGQAAPSWYPEAIAAASSFAAAIALMWRDTGDPALRLMATSLTTFLGILYMIAAIILRRGNTRLRR